MEMSTCFSVLTDYSKHISVANLLRRLSVLLFAVFLSFVSVNTLRGRFFFKYLNKLSHEKWIHKTQTRQEFNNLAF